VAPRVPEKRLCLGGGLRIFFLLGARAETKSDQSPETMAAPATRSTEEHVLLDRAKQGDERAFSELVRQYEDMVYNFSFKVCRDRGDATETLQDTFVNVYRKLGQFDGKSKFSTWLYTIVANNCLMKRRRQKLEKASVSIDEPELPGHDRDDGALREASLVAPWITNPLEQTMTKELRTLLDGAIQKLPVDYRLVFILRDLEGQSAEETAKIMKLSVPAVKSRLRRARVFLREQLNGYMAS
jgi:RNA polymerase sigma-70 factor (ECF subfamily)